MAVIQVKGGQGLLGGLGSIATIAGTFIPGAQWLTPLGLGLGTADNLINGNGGNFTNGNAMQNLLNGTMFLSNPAKGNIAKSKDKQVLDTLRRELGTQSQYNDYKVRSGK